MKLLNTEQAYRRWYMQDFLQLTDADWLTLEPEDIENDILRMKPDVYPCVGYILSSANPCEPQRIRYAYREEIMAWASAMA